MPAVHRVVLTGGPCAGKSTALSRAGEWLAACGRRVFRVPEASTMLLSGGMAVSGQPLAALCAFQRGVVEVQLALEAAFLRFAEASGEPAVLLLDRGVPDGAAYLPDAAWATLLGEVGLEHHTTRDGRYDAVVHLVTAARGAEGHYGTATNAVRYESLQGARGVDDRLLAAWTGHPRLTVVDNAGDFEAKMARVLRVVCEAVGAPAPESLSGR